jgi:hypothetical protein
MLECRGELKTLIKGVHQAQRDLAELRAIGADESTIRRVMVLMGFGGGVLMSSLRSGLGSDSATGFKGPPNRAQLTA